MPRCTAIKTSGERCQRIVASSSPYCYSHDPSRQAERTKNAATAGRGSREIRDVKQRLRRLYAALDAGVMDPRRGATLVQVANALLRAVQVEAELNNAAEMEKRLERIAALERQLRRTG